tara:strand:+ start:135 stop:341 length:207 start_codon:yes stop_codon:yes gene_type:complete
VASEARNFVEWGNIFFLGFATYRLPSIATNAYFFLALWIIMFQHLGESGPETRLLLPRGVLIHSSTCP